jgi:hypothetical protein
MQLHAYRLEGGLLAQHAREPVAKFGVLSTLVDEKTHKGSLPALTGHLSGSSAMRCVWILICLTDMFKKWWVADAEVKGLEPE